MNKIKNIVLSVNMDESSINEFRKLKNSQNLRAADNIHLIHIYNDKLKSNLPFSVNPDDFSEIEAYVTDRLHELTDELLPGHVNKVGDRHSLCVFNASEKLEIINYLDKVGADLVIVSTRRVKGLEGLSNNSFSFWLVEHAPCNVLIIRPK
jgi:hypothetical protein